MLAYERRGAEKPGLLAVGDEDDDVVRERGTRTQRANRLEDSGRAGGIVACCRPAGNSVVVRHQHDRRPTGRATRKTREHVADVPGFGIPRPDAGCLLDLRLEPERAQLRDHVVADARVVRAAGRMRPLRDLPHVDERPLGREFRGRRAGGDWRGWLAGTPNEQRAQQDERDHGRDSAAG